MRRNMWSSIRVKAKIEDTEAEARGALYETRTDAQQKYGKNDTTHCYNTICFIG